MQNYTLTPVVASYFISGLDGWWQVEALLTQFFFILVGDMLAPPIVKAMTTKMELNARAKKAETAVVQSELDEAFAPAEFNIGERVADRMKTFAAVLFFAGIFPFGYWMGFVALTVAFFADRHVLIRYVN
jgi:hypothetical protein